MNSGTKKWSKADKKSQIYFIQYNRITSCYEVEREYLHIRARNYRHAYEKVIREIYYHNTRKSLDSDKKHLSLNRWSEVIHNYMKWKNSNINDKLYDKLIVDNHWCRDHCPCDYDGDQTRNEEHNQQVKDNWEKLKQEHGGDQIRDIDRYCNIIDSIVCTPLSKCLRH
jgi:hypothetical protein